MPGHRASFGPDREAVNRAATWVAHEPGIDVDVLRCAALEIRIAILVASVVGPPPPSIEFVLGFAVSAWLLVAWAVVIERHRETVAPA